MIEVQNLLKQYGPHAAVDHVSFTVQKGVVLGLLGPNGAGKTTTMRILTTSLSPTAGTAKVAGFDVVEEPDAVRRRIGYLPEVPPLYPDMTVNSYLKFVAELKDVPRASVSARLEEVLEMLELEDMADRLVGHLSLGYRQRVGLAQALIHDPDVLILDEPTRGLDPKQIIEIRKLIKNLSGRKTVVLSTHILPEVESTCDEVVIIDRGKVVAADSVENLSRRISGAGALDVEIKGPAADVQKALAVLPGVREVRVTQKERRGIVRLEVVTEASRDVREEVFRLAVQEGWVLTRLAPLGLSLEEVFLRLTTKEAAA